MPKLSDEEKVSLEGYLTFEECQKILETLPNEKSPGEAAKMDLRRNFINTSLIWWGMILLKALMQSTTLGNCQYLSAEVWSLYYPKGMSH